MAPRFPTGSGRWLFVLALVLATLPAMATETSPIALRDA